MHHPLHHHPCGRGPRFWLPRILGGTLLGAGFVAAVGALLMLLWNALVPGLFGWPHLAYWQAVGILILARILFGGFGRGFHRKFHGPMDHGMHGPWAGRGAWGEWWKEKGRADFETWMKEREGTKAP
ncbi:MAG: hypothetical protein J0L75_12855 [Spirochaetes bacterium]|nr:hypothetical protein [Spirochaetota bacterium]